MQILKLNDEPIRVAMASHPDLAVQAKRVDGQINIVPQLKNILSGLPNKVSAAIIDLANN